MGSNSLADLAMVKSCYTYVQVLVRNPLYLFLLNSARFCTFFGRPFVKHKFQQTNASNPSGQRELHKKLVGRTKCRPVGPNRLQPN